MPVKAPPQVVAPGYNWTGFYVGINGGYGWGSSPTQVIGIDPTIVIPSQAVGALPTSLNPRMDGFLAGAQIGYNQQIGQFVAGLEADLDASGMRGNATYAVGPIAIPIGLDPPLTTEQINKLSWLGTVRPRLGWLMTPSTLIYGTGGLAYGEVKIQSGVSAGPPGGPCPGNEFCSAGSNSETRAGWTAGGGIEAVLGSNWTAKIEYLYFDLGSVSDGLISQSPLALGGHEIIATSVKVNGNIVRAGLNYKFN